MDSNAFGWELLMESVRSDSPSKRDLLVALVHWCLLKKKGTCLGIGNEKTLSPDEKGSETLPEGWNRSENYSLRYRLENNLFLLHATEYGGALLITLLDASDLNSSNIAVDIETTVENVEGKLTDMIPSCANLLSKINSTLFKAFSDKTSKDSQVQTDTPEKSKKIPDPDDEPGVPLLLPRNLEIPRREIEVGGADLDPFGIGGGMLFNPHRRQPEYPVDLSWGEFGRLPRGAVPPGARYDPMFPPGGDRRNNRRPMPDGDHLRPPSYDDMFL